MTWILFVFCVLAFDPHICAFVAPLPLPPLSTCPTTHLLSWWEAQLSGSRVATPGESSLKADYTLLVVNDQKPKQNKQTYKPQNQKKPG